MSAAFLHAGLAHLLSNMVVLLLIGPFCERAVGYLGTVFLYVAGAYVSAGSQWAADPSAVAPMVGASGAISTIVGSYVRFYGRCTAAAIGPFSRRVVNNAWLIATWSAINLVAQPLFAREGFGFAAWAHIGGFVLGLALARPLLWWRFRKA